MCVCTYIAFAPFEIFDILVLVLVRKAKKAMNLAFCGIQLRKTSQYTIILFKLIFVFLLNTLSVGYALFALYLV